MHILHKKLPSITWYLGLWKANKTNTM